MTHPRKLQLPFPSVYVLMKSGYPPGRLRPVVMNRPGMVGGSRVGGGIVGYIVADEVTDWIWNYTHEPVTG